MNYNWQLYITVCIAVPTMASPPSIDTVLAFMVSFSRHTPPTVIRRHVLLITTLTLNVGKSINKILYFNKVRMPVNIHRVADTIMVYKFVHTIQSLSIILLFAITLASSGTKYSHKVNESDIEYRLLLLK